MLFVGAGNTHLVEGWTVAAVDRLCGCNATQRLLEKRAQPITEIEQRQYEEAVSVNFFPLCGWHGCGYQGVLS